MASEKDSLVHDPTHQSVSKSIFLEVRMCNFSFAASIVETEGDFSRMNQDSDPLKSRGVRNRITPRQIDLMFRTGDFKIAHGGYETAAP